MTVDLSDIVVLLEKNWDTLQTELGQRWPEFVDEYRAAVGKWPSVASPEDSEHLADDLCDLLARYDFGRGLLHCYTMLYQEKFLPSGRKVLADRESLNQLCNRLKKLPERPARPTS